MSNNTGDVTVVKVNDIDGVNIHRELRLTIHDANLLSRYLTEHPEVKTLDTGGVYLDNLFLESSEGLLSQLKDKEISLTNFLGDSELLTENGIPFERVPKEGALALAAGGLSEGKGHSSEHISIK